MEGGGHINEPYFGENRHYELSFFFVLIVLYVENEGGKYFSKAEYPPSFKNERNIYKYKNIKTDKICLHFLISGKLQHVAFIQTFYQHLLYRLKIKLQNKSLLSHLFLFRFLSRLFFKL